MALVHGCQWLPLVALARLDKGRVRGGEGGRGRRADGGRMKGGKKEGGRDGGRWIDIWIVMEITAQRGVEQGEHITDS